MSHRETFFLYCSALVTIPGIRGLSGESKRGAVLKAVNLGHSFSRLTLNNGELLLQPTLLRLRAVGLEDNEINEMELYEG